MVPVHMECSFWQRASEGLAGSAAMAWGHSSRTAQGLVEGTPTGPHTRRKKIVKCTEEVTGRDLDSSTESKKPAAQGLQERDLPPGNFTVDGKCVSTHP